MKKSFPVIIHEKQYWVWDIEGKEHAGPNGEVKTWWLYYADDLPEGLTPPIDSKYWEPYCRSINRQLWDIRFKQHNTTKEKWGETDFRNHTSVEMWCNGKMIYAFGTAGSEWGLSFAFAKVQYLQVILSEHCFNFFDPEKENGRKILWYGLPATVVISKHQSWEIQIKPDYTAGLSRNEWWAEYFNRKRKVGVVDNEFTEMEKDDDEEDFSNDLINWGDALSDQHINWFRS